MDAFYASVEQRDHPAWRGLPLIVGGAGRRGVVCAASYEARRFGVRSAMPVSRAIRLCPQAILTPPRFSIYEGISQEIQRLLQNYTDRIEPIALDESFLDVSEYCRQNLVKAGLVAHQLRRQIFRETGLTASAGVAPNKLVAKIASGHKKPDGLTVVAPEQVADFLSPLPIGELWGVGPVTEKRFQHLGIATIGDLANYSAVKLMQQIGAWAPYWQQLARGLDERPVETQRETRSISTEHTFENDITDSDFLRQVLESQLLDLQRRLTESQLRARTIVLKLRFADFTTITRSHSQSDYSSQMEFLKQAVRLLNNQLPLPPVRLIGLGVTNLASARAPYQLMLDFPASSS